jgi:hypothetical protein
VSVPSVSPSKQHGVFECRECGGYAFTAEVPPWDVFPDRWPTCPRGCDPDAGCPETFVGFPDNCRPRLLRVLQQIAT